jgi:threonine dehydrogenase-like Zn-dependent dehydrogenase
LKTKAVRIHGKEDLRLEEFELPQIGEEEILARVVSDSICMSSFKAAEQGAAHKRVPDDVARNPTIIGHEFCGDILEVGAKWRDKFKPGLKFAIQPAMNYKGSLRAPGYSYRFAGGASTFVIIPNEVMETGCLLPYNSDTYFYGSLAEPMSCIVGAYHANYHTTSGSYVHDMGIREGGNAAILAGAGPMGLGAIDYAVHCDRKPALLAVTDIDDARLARAAEVLTVEEAAKHGVRLVYFNTSLSGAKEEILALTNGRGYDDVFVFAPVKPVVEFGDEILARDGCLNFFAGPLNPGFTAEFNFYNVHYGSTHIVGTSGGNTDDMLESISMMSEGTLNPSAMITHIGGLDAVIHTTLNLPKIPGGKKLIYTHIEMPLTALTEFEEKGKTNLLFERLDQSVKAHNNLWNAEAEKILLKHFGVIEN